MITFNEKSDQTVYTESYGACFKDEKGKEYINLNDISCILGYNHPTFIENLVKSAQTKTIAHMGNLSDEKEKLIQNMMEITHHDFDQFFMASSGGEVVDWSIKLARRVTGKDTIISFQNALHGRSFAGAYLSGIPLRKDGFGTGLENVEFWPYPEDGRSYEPTCDEYKDVAAIIIEPYQALGGMVTPSLEYWKWLRDYTRKNNIVLIFDEIQTGFGKTGTFFVYETLGIVPDILLMGKGMSNGFGLGGLLMSKEVASCIQNNEMSGGSADNDFMCSTVNSVISIIEKENILSHVQEMAEFLKNELSPLGKVNGKGLFMSLEIDEEKISNVQSLSKEKGILFGKSKNKLFIRSPLVVTKKELEKTCCILREIVNNI